MIVKTPQAKRGGIYQSMFNFKVICYETLLFFRIFQFVYCC